MSQRKVVPSKSHFVDGFQIPALFSADTFRSAVSYQPRADELFIVTYPKCGTTWAQQVVVLILRQGEPIESVFQFFAATPFLEVTGASAAEEMTLPNAIKVHLPYHLTPRCSTAKYLYVTRNPKDCCISFFHHMKSMPVHGYDGDFDDFFEIFLSGQVDYGDYFDHLLGWYEHRNDPNVLFVTYEEMKEHPKDAILKIASFIDDDLYGKPLREDATKLESVLKFSSFDYMKKKFNDGMDQLFNASPEDIMNSELPASQKMMLAQAERPKEKPSPSTFVRKGVIGDWRNYLNDDQNSRFDEKIAAKFQGTDLEMLWKKYM